MSLLKRKQPTKQDQAVDWLTTALKAAALGVAARGAGKATKKGAKTGAKKGAKTAARRGGKGLGKRLAPLALIGAAVVFAKKARSKGAEHPVAAAPTPPTPVTPPEPAHAPTPPPA